MNMQEAALNIANISHAYGARKALDSVSFAVASGRFVGLLGLNGAGKSTLFSLITRLFPIQSGKISVFGYDIERTPSAALARLGVVFQPRTLDLDLSVRQNLTYHAALHGIGTRAAHAYAEEMLKRVALSDRAGDKVRNLSGGQMRRVEIARALLHRPRLVILDEPTVGLDIKARREILQHVRSLVREGGISVVWATHLVDEIETGDDLLVLHRGRLVAQGTAGEIIAQTKSNTLSDAFSQLTQDSRESAA
jgi:ABC-2 type transport system ATP-binding protein